MTEEIRLSVVFASNAFAIIQMTPPLDYYNMVREIRRIGYIMRQVAQRAYTQNFVDAPLYNENAQRVLNACDDLIMICLPRGEET